MKKIIFYFIVLLLFIWLGLFISKDSGYILINYGNITIETTLWVGIIVLLAGFLSLYLVIRLTVNIKRLPNKIKKWRSNKKTMRAIAQLKKGVISIINGKWKKAEHFLVRVLKAKNMDLELVGRFACALLADKQGNHDKCDSHLSLALVMDKKSFLEIELLRAQFQVQNEQWREALVTLNQLQKKEPKHKTVLFLLYKTYFQLKEWYSLQFILPFLRRYKILSYEEAVKSESIICKEILLESIKSSSVDKTIETWHKMPRSIHRDAEIMLVYLAFLKNQGLHSKVERILFKFLPKIWDKKLIEQYGLFVSAKPIKQLRLAEKWLQNHKQDADLLLCLGRICKQQKLWGKAKSYLEQGIEISPIAVAYYELGQIMEMQGDKVAALNSYRSGLNITSL